MRPSPHLLARAASAGVLRAALALALVVLGTGLAAVTRADSGSSTHFADRHRARRAPSAAVALEAPARFSAALPAEHTAAQLELPEVAPPPVSPIPAAVPTADTLPVGKGMWIWLPEVTEGGDPVAIVEKARAVGLNHLYVRTGSSIQGFHGAAFLDALLPHAHAAGIRVFGWDFPYFIDVGADVGRALDAITHRTPDGHHIDGFVPDIETRSEGTRLTVENVRAYNTLLRAAVGEDYPLIVTVPRPSDLMVDGRYPYAEVVEPYDAIIPMVYWLNRQPDTDVAGAIDWLRQFDKPIIPVGQAYDGAAEGGRPGTPPGHEIQRFISTAAASGATGVSFWSWQHASAEIWMTYAAAHEFTVHDGAPPELSADQITGLQVLLTSLGHLAPVTGRWDPATVEALRAAQRAEGIEPTGSLDEPTRSALLDRSLGLIDLG